MSSRVFSTSTKFEILEICPGLIHFEFSSQAELAATFLRFQEHYESPFFKNKIFTLEEFSKWYKSQHGSFSYTRDWSGFNVPSKAFKPFFQQKFNPLTLKEKQLIKALKPYKKFYAIGTYKINGKTDFSTLKHEIAHAFYFLYPSYRKKVNKLISKANLKPFNEAFKKMGYHESVWRDEAHAYLLCESSWMKKHNLNSLKNKRIQKELDLVFKEYYSPIKAG